MSPSELTSAQIGRFLKSFDGDILIELRHKILFQKRFRIDRRFRFRTNTRGGWKNTPINTTNRMYDGIEPTTRILHAKGMAGDSARLRSRYEGGGVGVVHHDLNGLEKWSQLSGLNRRPTVYKIELALF